MNLEQPKLLVSPSGIEAAKKAIADSGKRLDVYQLEQEFKTHAEKTGFKPGNVDGAFVNFVRKRVGFFQ